MLGLSADKRMLRVLGLGIDGVPNMEIWIAAGELGWRINSFMRGSVDIAMKRAKYWMLPTGDLHGAFCSIS